MTRAAAFEQVQPLLVALASRMLDRVSEAELSLPLIRSVRRRQARKLTTVNTAPAT